MKKISSKLLLLGFMGVTSNIANATVITYSDLALFNAATVNNVLVEDFESVPAYPTVTTSLTHNDITYTGLATHNNVTVASPGFTNFGIPGATTTSILTGNGTDNVQIDFALPMEAVGFDTYLNSWTYDAGGANVDVYGASGLLSSFQHNHDFTQVGFLGILADEDITRIVWTTTNGNLINTGIDNVRLADAVNVPEPGTLALLALGLLGVRSRFKK